jgi:hypothetical protein
MQISDSRVITDAAHCELQAKVETDRLPEPFLLRYRFPAAYSEAISSENGDPFLAALLPSAMALGEPLQISVPVSPKLLHATHQIQAILKCWYPALSQVPIEAVARSQKPPSQANADHQTGLFFSLGVDSFYTLLKNISGHLDHNQAITHLITVHGFDVFFDKWNKGLFPKLLANSLKVADVTEKEVLPVTTNLRDFVDQFTSWGYVSHGAAMASVGLALGPAFQTIYIAASYTYAELYPLGSHPLLDPFWGTESLSFAHDGCEATRVDKHRLLAQSPVALETLRTCTVNSVEYNCGQCHKCLLTMIGLHIVGALEQSKTFPHYIDLQRLAEVLPRGGTYPHGLLYEMHLLNGLGSSETDRAIRAILEDALRQARLDPAENWRRGSMENSWMQQLYRLTRHIEKLIPPGDTFILVDDEQLGEISSKRCSIPFLERHGKYWGVPADDGLAIQELERLRREGAGWIGFAWPSFWWLNEYAGLDQHVRSTYRCVLEDDCVVIFDLRTRLAGACEVAKTR